MIIKTGDKPLSFLLVEDDQVDIMNLKRAFKKNEIENPLHIAGNGIEALEMLRNKQLIPEPKIILLDINMPKMNGLEFLKELRKDEELKSLMVFVMTTSNEDSDKIEAYNFNVAGYILKPVSFDRFSDAVKKLSDFWSIIEFKS